MERLTKLNKEIGKYQTTDNADIYYTNTQESIFCGNAINRLGELEDVLEKYGIESAKELDGALKPLIDNGELENWRRVIFWKNQTERLRQELAELKQKATMPKEDKFVIVSNAWKHKKKYGIAKVQQIITDYYILQTYDYLGSYVPCIQFGEFKTLEEAEQKLTEIKGEKDE